LSIKIDVRNGNLEQAMRVLKKKVLKEGIFRLAKEKSVYEKPSERKRRKKKEGIANFKKEQKKLRLTKRLLIKFLRHDLMYIYYC
jgi:small subunit ribosomal protein S21